MKTNVFSTLAAVLALIVLPAHATTIIQPFGSGANTFNIPFVPIGNAGNGPDTTGYGAVSYNYNISTYGISWSQMDRAAASGFTNAVAGSFPGDRPANNLTWYQAAAFVNWLNSSTGHQAAYNLDPGATTLTLWGPAQAWQLGGQNLYRHKDAYYFLPSESEYYKAAYHKNDGVTNHYWTYATGSNTIPTPVAGGTGAGTVVYGNDTGSPAPVDSSGGLSPYGTMGQSGNLYSYLESAFDGVNDVPGEDRALRGSMWLYHSEFFIQAGTRGQGNPAGQGDEVYKSLRVASVVPEPSTTVSMISASLLALARRRRRAALWTVSGAAGAKGIS